MEPIESTQDEASFHPFDVVEATIAEVAHSEGTATLRIPSDERRRPSLFSSLVTVLAEDDAGRIGATYAIVRYGLE